MESFLWKNVFPFMKKDFIHRNNPTKQPRTNLYTKLSTISTNEKTNALRKNQGEQERVFCEIRQQEGEMRKKEFQFEKKNCPKTIRIRKQ